MRPPKLTDDEFLTRLKNNPAYTGLDIEREIAKADAWLLAHPDRKRSREFLVNWLNKAERPFLSTPPDPYANKPMVWQCPQGHIHEAPTRAGMPTDKSCTGDKYVVG